jgi:DnaJ-class molecular chaperone
MNNNPIKEIPFNGSMRVICGRCKGEKELLIDNSRVNCPLCLGEGFLLRVTEGTVKLFTIK